MTTDTARLWKTVLGEIEVGMTPASFQTWFKNTDIDEVDLEKGVVVVRVPNEFTKGWLQQKYQKEIHKCLTRHLDKVVVVQYVVGTKRPTQPALRIDEKVSGTGAQAARGLDLPEDRGVLVKDVESLNPRFTFEQFVEGENSKLCYAAAQSVAKQPGLNYNPLFIYGGVGLGKTHLLQAIGNEVLKNNKKARVVYVTSEKFTNEMVEAIREKDTRKFKEKYRKVDCLLIDDVQFLAGKEQTQEEFFHTFNALYNDGRQIVLTSDRPPKAISALEDRLRSRFESGMIADISIPSFETRLAILHTKLAEKGREMDEGILSYIAKLAKNNVRELEGALNRVAAFSDLNDAPATLEDAKNLLGGIMSAPGRKVVRPSEIIKAVSNHFNIKKEDLSGRKKTREVVTARQILVYLLREELDMPYKQIGSEIGGRDHTTIMHDYNKMKGLLLQNDFLGEEIVNIKNKLYAVD
ncbi:MAG: chromosomal replication initiator protein DnaA [Patescibacteria group bacterium]|nr:chromosomal replication initiator protein DnaA [Patescibacteria group bacterium]